MRICVILYSDYKRLYEFGNQKTGTVVVSGGTIKVVVDNESITAPCFIEKRFSNDTPMHLQFDPIYKINASELVGIHAYEKADELDIVVEYPFK